MATEIVRRRRHYSAELKEKVLLECAQPGPSVSMVAMAYGINANTPWWKTPCHFQKAIARIIKSRPHGFF